MKGELREREGRKKREEKRSSRSLLRIEKLTLLRRKEKLTLSLEKREAHSLS
eukprot:EC795809.1.p3 GENE.EC795809.1~~EC795809.1.p3  ORF type:complete len:52 (+),score=2.33 EC795809.1:381-536(+)